MDIDELRVLFEDNFEELKYETGRSITPNMKELAWQQVRLYYEKMGEIAKKMTETEVKLILPEQVTPEGKKYTIEGVVDIVQEEDRITMYDIKTHNSRDVESNKELYKGQLNIYAHIWENLRNTVIDKVAIIATEPPVEIREAIDKGDDDLLKSLIKSWNPIVDLDFDDREVTKQIKSFGEVVDKIEDRKFKSPSLAQLKQVNKGQKTPFGTAVCRHCDARYSCSSYDKYIKNVKLDKKTEKIAETEDNVEQEEWKESLIK